MTRTLRANARVSRRRGENRLTRERASAEVYRAEAGGLEPQRLATPHPLAGEPRASRVRLPTERHLPEEGGGIDPQSFRSALLSKQAWHLASSPSKGKQETRSPLRIGARRFPSGPGALTGLLSVTFHAERTSTGKNGFHSSGTCPRSVGPGRASGSVFGLNGFLSNRIFACSGVRAPFLSLHA